MCDKLKSVRWAFECSSWKPTNASLLVGASAIQPEEKERVGKFVFQKDAKRALVGRLLIRHYIHQASHFPWSDIRLGRDENNKPFLMNEMANSPLQFNISHSGKYVVLAGEPGNAKLGIDVMKTEYSGGKGTSEFFRIMARHFAPEEWTTIKNVSFNEEQQLKMFFRHWCLKESYVKATGTGITVNLQEICFKLHSENLECNKFVEDTELYLKGEKQTDWLFQETLLDNEHIASVALCDSDLGSRKGILNRFSLIDFKDIVKGCQQLTPPDEEFCLKFLEKETLPEQ